MSFSLWRESFCADMRSTERNKSLNSVIKKYLHPKQRPLDFFTDYERAVEER